MEDGHSPPCSQKGIKVYAGSRANLFLGGIAVGDQKTVSGLIIALILAAIVGWFLLKWILVAVIIIGKYVVDAVQPSL